jgi:hypothetical protein
MSEICKPAALVQADPREPHWIVVCLSHRSEAPAERGRSWRTFFRHPTEALANVECGRLAARFPGKRFAVYASGLSHKVERARADLRPQAGGNEDTTAPAEVAP